MVETEAKVKAVTSQTDEFEALLQEAGQYVKEVSMVNLMKVASRGLKTNEEFDKFLSGDFKKLTPKAFRPEEVEAALNRVFMPTKHEHHGIPNLKKQQAVLRPISPELVAREVAAKTQWIATLDLDDEQQTKAAEALKGYERYLKGLLNTSVDAWQKTYGVK